jgi:hypothetical protein
MSGEGNGGGADSGDSPDASPTSPVSSPAAASSDDSSPTVSTAGPAKAPTAPSPVAAVPPTTPTIGVPALPVVPEVTTPEAPTAPSPVTTVPATKSPTIGVPALPVVPEVTTPGTIGIGVNITYKIGESGGGVGDIPAAPTEAELMELMNVTVDFYNQTMYDAFNSTFIVFKETGFMDLEAPGIGWTTNLLAEVEFSSLPSTDDVVKAIEGAAYQMFIAEQVIPIVPYFASTTGLDVVAGAVVVR